MYQYDNCKINNNNNDNRILINRFTFIKYVVDLFSTNGDSTTTDEDSITETGNLQYVQ